MRYPADLRNLGILALVATMTTIFGVDIASAFSAGPPDGRTGAPGEGNCTQCHSSFPLDSGLGEAYMLDFDEPNEYQAEQLHFLTFEVADDGALRWGFEVTILDAAGNQAGTLMAADGNVQVSSSNVSGQTRQYAKQTSVGTYQGTSGWASWFVDWIAPAGGTGTVYVYGMANAANNNFSNGGDRIYSIYAEIPEAATDAGAPPVFADLKPNFPNPFNPKTRIDYSLEREADVRLSIYDAGGRLVKVLFEGYLAAGEHGQEWNGTDTAGNASASGTYFARLQGAGGVDLDAPRKMTLIK